MTHPDAVAIKWDPEAPTNRRRWEAEIRSAPASSIGVKDVEMVENETCRRVQTAKVGGVGIGTAAFPPVPEPIEMREAVTEHLVAMGFPVCS